MMILGIGNKVGSKKCDGFSLIEILLVVVILGVIVTMTIPNFHGSFQGLQLKRSIEKIAQLLRYAQSRSILKNRCHRVVFDSKKRSYWLEEADGRQEDVGVPISYRRLNGRWGKIKKVDESFFVSSDEDKFYFSDDGRIKGADINLCKNDTSINKPLRCMNISTKLQGSIHVRMLVKKN